ncbi:unnamed protein product [Dibothriocephalus latus]|uniref:PRELI/MSF1 domain-containing protein n=1 Tax=Dibothriocephalus latus TaxID=60516 RepID=A0A3P7PCS7_DIBLA|nr:unnamed protein product [Dibothriocephalus latus]
MVASPYTWEGEFVLHKPWADVMRAAQVKYPNPFNPNVLSIDVLSREIDPDESNNVDLRGVIKAYEKLEYKAHPENKEWTVVRHTVAVDAFSLVAYPALSVSKKNAKLVGRLIFPYSCAAVQT